MQTAKRRTPGWATFTGLAIVHLGALCAFIPGTFHWSALIVMAVLYFSTIVPFALIMRLLKRDVLRLKWDPCQTSYWIPRKPPGPGPESMKDQF